MSSRSSIRSPPRSSPRRSSWRKQVIETFDAPLDLTTYKDEYREGLQKIIDAKIAGEEVVAPTIEAPPKVVNLMEALRKSLDAVGTSKKKTAKAIAKMEPVKRKRAG